MCRNANYYTFVICLIGWQWQFFIHEHGPESELKPPQKYYSYFVLWGYQESYLLHPQVLAMVAYNGWR